MYKKVGNNSEKKDIFSKYFSLNSPEDIYIATTEGPGKNRNGQ